MLNVITRPPNLQEKRANKQLGGQTKRKGQITYLAAHAKAAQSDLEQRYRSQSAFGHCVVVAYHRRVRTFKDLFITTDAMGTLLSQQMGSQQDDEKAASGPLWILII